MDYSPPISKEKNYTNPTYIENYNKGTNETRAHTKKTDKEICTKKTIKNKKKEKQEKQKTRKKTKKEQQKTSNNQTSRNLIRKC